MDAVSALEPSNGHCCKPLTIKTASSDTDQCKKTTIIPVSPSIESSPLHSPSLISPPSSAFVSALQSPYISPRALNPPPPENQPEAPPPPPATRPSPPVSYCGSHSDDIPSTSYTPPPERFDFSDEQTDPKIKYTTCFPTPEPAPPRISFSFQVPRISFAKGSLSPSSNAKLRSCDVYIGYHGQSSNLARFCKWLKSELELQGIACFVADRAKYSDNQSHEIADRIICSATFGVVVVTSASFLNHLSIEEIVFFTQKKNLIPVLFDIDPGEISGLASRNSDDREWKDAIESLIKFHEFKLEANDSNWRSCVARATAILRGKLGRKSISKIEPQIHLEELPFPRNKFFVGREKELMEMDTAFFGCGDSLDRDYSKPAIKGGGDGSSEGFADEESDTISTKGGRFISLEMRKCKEPTLEAWIEPVFGKSPSKRPKHKKSISGNNRSLNNVVCVMGASGIGKTELALEFAYRYLQRYKMVLWVGGEARYFRQNILNLSMKLGLDVSAEPEKERGRIKSFEEQEIEAFLRVKRELFRDMPYLLIIDNLETEKEWWDNKDLHDLIPRNTGATHVIVTTRLPKVMNFDLLQLSPLPFSDAMTLTKGKRKDYPTEELEFLRKFDERLGRSSFGLWIVGSLLSELAISPSALFDAVNQVPFDDDDDDDDSSLHSSSTMDEQLYKNNPFLMKILNFCLIVLDQASRRRNLLTSRMLLAGAWFAPAPISVNLLATAAKKLPAARNQLKQWTRCIRMALCCSSGCCASQGRKSEVESALLLVKLGLAKRTSGRSGCLIQFHPITQVFAKRKGGLAAAKAAVYSVRKIGNPILNSDHLWSAAFIVFGFKSDPPIFQMKAIEMVLFIQKIALPLARWAFTTFSRCNSSLELLKVCTNVLEEVEKSFLSQIQDLCHGSLCWKRRLQSHQRVDEYVWQDVTLLKATLLETRAKLLLRGGNFDSGEELCRTCISIRTVMLGHNHAQTLAAQETLAKLVRSRSKM